ncbi:hypothetical protein [Paenirhodobacter populi]|uniref:hypothetical protein n=1 Tax=Paenirhodobacter populi TaxID=2306993 RepID=UPI000FE300AF|nr:hypothetical protein [Sinirhodobacter populi]RWR05852.1 hypothetical protein D2T32_15570 [Sinirhodobacter populi]
MKKFRITSPCLGTGCGQPRAGPKNCMKVQREIPVFAFRTKSKQAGQPVVIPVFFHSSHRCAPDRPKISPTMAKIFSSARNSISGLPQDYRIFVDRRHIRGMIMKTYYKITRQVTALCRTADPSGI